jgi:restriction system protein
MVKKKKQSPLEDWVDLVALLPWWMGVTLAAIFYFWLHHVATAPIPPIVGGKVGEALPQMLYRSFATIGQYLVPFVCLLGAALSAWGRSKREKLFSDAGAGESVSALNGMSWQEFEMLVGEAFRKGGFSVAETGGGGADGGVDLVLRKDGEKYLVQCKQWKAYKVGVQVVRELYGVMAASGAVGGFVVTSGVFTQEAKDFASGRNIELVDGAELKQIISRVQSSCGTQSDEAKYSQVKHAIPNCPTCGGSMVKRIAKQGANAGKMFWGCSSYPKCRGIVAID